MIYGVNDKRFMKALEVFERIKKLVGSPPIDNHKLDITIQEAFKIVSKIMWTTEEEEGLVVELLKKYKEIIIFLIERLPKMGVVRIGERTTSVYLDAINPMYGWRCEGRNELDETISRIVGRSVHHLEPRTNLALYGAMGTDLRYHDGYVYGKCPFGSRTKIRMGKFIRKVRDVCEGTGAIDKGDITDEDLNVIGKTYGEYSCPIAFDDIEFDKTEKDMYERFVELDNITTCIKRELKESEKELEQGFFELPPMIGVELASFKGPMGIQARTYIYRFDNHPPAYSTIYVSNDSMTDAIEEEFTKALGSKGYVSMDDIPVEDRILRFQVPSTKETIDCLYQDSLYAVRKEESVEGIYSMSIRDIDVDENASDEELLCLGICNRIHLTQWEVEFVYGI